jgi:hypothetical protein
LAALASAGLPTEMAADHLRVAVGADRAEDVTRLLAGSGQWVRELVAERRSLEDLFFELTGDGDEVPDQGGQELEEVVA